MKIIYILRSAQYNYSVPEKSLYQSFDLVARRLEDPNIDISTTIEHKHKLNKLVNSHYCVLTSFNKRSFQTGNLISKKIQNLSLLKEIEYKMSNFISEKEFYDKNGNPNVNLARQKFVYALIESKLEEKYPSVINRIEKLLLFSKNINSESIVIFTHGFFMKVIEAYIRDKSIKNKPKRLLKYFSGKTETFKFCNGFKLELKNDKFVFKNYLEL